MNFSRNTYENFITETSQAQSKLFQQYPGNDTEFDIIIVGSGMGGGILADDLADKFTANGIDKRVLILEAGSYIYPTHIYNICRFDNASIANEFEVKKTFQQPSLDDRGQFYIGENPQLNFGGRSIFWSGLVPKLRSWEQGFFPDTVRSNLPFYLDKAEQKLNVSESLGNTAKELINAFKKDDFLSKHFDIEETPRALHQPYLMENGEPKDEFFIESTGVFNTAELLINQIDFCSQSDPSINCDKERKKANLNLFLNHFVVSISRRADGKYEITARDTLNERSKVFTATYVVLATGSIETPKLMRRSQQIFNDLPTSVQALVGKGLTDHPTTDPLSGRVTHINNEPVPRNAHAKIMLYSKGNLENDKILYPFNIEININQEYWHRRENDPTNPKVPLPADISSSQFELKFSFGNFLDDDNEIIFRDEAPFLPDIRFSNHRWTSYLDNRFKALAGWNVVESDVFAAPNEVAGKIFDLFKNDDGDTNYGKLGENGKGFGYGTVHHAVGTMRMPYKNSFDGSFNADAVVDENLMVRGMNNLFVCDMSVMPYSATANPVLHLAALALRLSDRIQNLVRN